MTATQPAAAEAPFGRMLTAMITPMTADGGVDYDGAGRLATYLVDEMRNDGLVISGTTGESPTTTDAEKERLLRAVIEAVGDRAAVVAGVGTNDTAHTCELARQAERAGALRTAPGDAVLQQAAAERARWPTSPRPPTPPACRSSCMTYRAGRATPIATESLLQLAEHPRIIAVKDAKGDLGAGSLVMLATGLVFYCGDDMLNLPWLSVGAAGFVSVVGHVAGDRLHEMIDAYRAGRVDEARRIHCDLLPLYTGIMTRTQGVITTKAALSLLGLPGGPVRGPLIDATPAEIEQLRADLVAGGVKIK